MKKMLFVMVMALAMVRGVSKADFVLWSDDFTSDTLDPAWTEVYLLSRGQTGYTYSTTTNNDQMRITGYNSNAEQWGLLRDDRQLGIGETLQVDIVSTTMASQYSQAGLLLHTGTDVGLTDLTGASPTNTLQNKVGYIEVTWRPSSNRVHTEHWTTTNKNGGSASGTITGTLAQLWIRRDTTDTYSTGYVDSAGSHTLFNRVTKVHEPSTIGFYHDMRASGEYIVYDNLKIVPVSELLPSGPQTTSVPDGAYCDVAMKWFASLEPTDVVINTDVIKQYVYLSEDQNVSSDPNLYYVGQGTWAGSDPVSSYLANDLNFAGSYNWAVVNVLSGYDYTPTVGVSTLTSADPNNLIGYVWSFETIPAVPQIVQQPSDVAAHTGETDPAKTTITGLEVFSASQEHYRWYRTPDNTNTTPGDDTPVSGAPDFSELSLGIGANFNGDDDGYYYCLVYNDVTNDILGDADDVVSDVVSAVAQRKVAHWTLNNDGSGYSGGQYLDSSGEGHNADPNGPGAPNWQTGVVDGSCPLAKNVSGGAVKMDVDSFAAAGTWDPAEYSGQVSVSFWIKWDGDTTVRHLVSKYDYYGDGNRWDLTARFAGKIYLTTDGGSVYFNTDAGTLVQDTWAFVTAVLDGSNGYIYVDGHYAASDAGGLGNHPDAKAATIHIGDGVGQLKLDDVRIYNYALTQNEVAAIYYAETCVPICDLANPLISTNYYDVAGGGISGDEPDCRVDLADFAAFAQEWLDCVLYPNTVCP